MALPDDPRVNQAHTSGLGSHQLGDNGGSRSSCDRVVLAAIAPVAFAGSESAAGAMRARTPGVRKVHGSLLHVLETLAEL